MSTYPFITRAVLLSSMLLIASLSAPTVHALDSDLLKGTMVFAPASELNVVAAGAVEDTLNVCLGRIPLERCNDIRRTDRENEEGHQPGHQGDGGSVCQTARKAYSYWASPDRGPDQMRYGGFFIDSAARG